MRTFPFLWGVQSRTPVDTSLLVPEPQASHGPSLPLSGERPELLTLRSRMTPFLEWDLAEYSGYLSPVLGRVGPREWATPAQFDTLWGEDFSPSVRSKYRFLMRRRVGRKNVDLELQQTGNLTLYCTPVYCDQHRHLCLALLLRRRSSLGGSQPTAERLNRLLVVQGLEPWAS